MVKWFHDKLHKKVFPWIKKQMTGRRGESAGEVIASSVEQYGSTEGQLYQVVFKSSGKGGDLFEKRGDTLYVNKDHPESRVPKSGADKLVLAAVLVLSGRVSTQEIEAMLQKIKRVKREVKKIGKS